MDETILLMSSFEFLARMDDPSPHEDKMQGQATSGKYLAKLRKR